MTNKKIFSLCIFSACIAIQSCQQAPDAELSAKPSSIDRTMTSISGLSSGGFMATQFHLAHAEDIVGVGIVSAGPYYCAQGSITTALQDCIHQAPEKFPDSLFSMTNDINTTEKLAKPKSIENDKVWLLHGTKDTRVNAKATDALYQQYQQWVKPQYIQYINDKPFAHVMPTIESGGQCAESNSPFIGACGYDAAGEILQHIFDDLKAPVEDQEIATMGELIRFKQSELADLSDTGMNETGFAYIPSTCQQGNNCKVHISFHGCNQSIDNIDDQYARLSGFNRWAASNNMIVLYPQTEKSTMLPMNPQACWDWWGYTDENYANKEGKQIKAVYQMLNNVERLLESKK